MYFDDLMQERHNFIANALELRLSCINPSIWKNLEQLKHGADICDCETVATLNIDFFFNFI